MLICNVELTEEVPFSAPRITIKTSCFCSVLDLQVYLSSVVRPGTKHQLTELIVKRKPLDIDGARAGEDPRGRLLDCTVRFENNVYWIRPIECRIGTGNNDISKQWSKVHHPLTKPTSLTTRPTGTLECHKDMRRQFQNAMKNGLNVSTEKI